MMPILRNKDGNEKLCLKELKTALIELAGDCEELETAKNDAFVEALMDIADEDKDKLLSMDEIMKLMTLLQEDDGKGLMQKIFRNADKDGNGYLTAKELKDLFKVLALVDEPQEDIDEMLGFILAMGEGPKGEKKLKIEEAMKFFGCGTEPRPEDPKEKMKVMFKMCDTNGDGMSPAVSWLSSWEVWEDLMVWKIHL